MTMQMIPAPQVVRVGGFSIQVCVPATWTDDQVKDFADRENLCGTTNGWQIRREGDEALAGAAERVPCQLRADCVHVMLDA